MSLLFRFLILLALTGCVSRSIYIEPAPQLANVSIVDRNGVTETISNRERLQQYECVDFLKNQPYCKVIRVFARDSCGDVYAYITTYHENGQPKQYLEAVNNRAFGSYREWYTNGSKAVEAYIVGGMADVNTAGERSWLFDGVCRAYDDEERLEAEIHYAKGELHGYSLYYHPSGALWKSAPFTKNQLHGSVDIFLENGDKLQSTPYINGKKQGVALRWWNPDLIASEECWDNDTLSEGHYYDREGHLICSIEEGRGVRAIFSRDDIAELQEWQNGVQEGLVRLFHANGGLYSVYRIKNGKKHGEEIVYHDPLSYCPKEVKQLPKLLLTWYEGKIQGTVKTWYPNGQQESQREMNQNVKNGLLSGWYQDGSLMLIEEYEHDKLLKGEYYRKGENEPVSLILNGEGYATLFDNEGNYLRKVQYHNFRPLE